MTTDRPASVHHCQLHGTSAADLCITLVQVQGKYEVLAQESDVVGVHLAHVPNTDKFLYMERPSPKRSRTRQIAGTHTA